MSSWRTFLLGHGDFMPPDEIVKQITKSKNFNPLLEDPEFSEALLIFQTSQQQTWLVASNIRLYFVLDDLGKGSTAVLWSLPAEELIRDGRFIARISVQYKTERTGVIKFNDHRGYLYSKKLFTSESIEKQVKRLVRDRMSLQEA